MIQTDVMPSAPTVLKRSTWIAWAPSLAFGLRNWAAMMLALYVAFWLQLDSASSAAVCVGILALPTRGQVLQKALYRVLGTVIGVTASFVIAGLFNEARELFVVAFAAWLGLCVFAAGFLDGNRAYGAVLSGYTVAIVAVAQIDAPQNVFDSGINRAAAIIVGILAIVVINALFAAPALHAGFMKKIGTIRDRVQDFTIRSLDGAAIELDQVADLYAAIAALHTDITAMPLEASRGRERASGARIAVISMVQQIMVARAVAFLLTTAGPAADRLRESLIDRISSRQSPEPNQQQTEIGRAQGQVYDPQLRAAAYAGVRLIGLNDTVDAALDRMRSGAVGPAGASLPLFRLPREAAYAGARTFLAVLLTAVALSLMGWPEASLGLAFVGATLGIGGTNAKPREFALMAMVAMPLAVLLAGVTQFLVLDGADGFPELALAMALPVIGASLLITTGKPALVGLGFLIIVFFPVLLSPSNPQNYDPQTFLDTSVLAITAVVGVFVLLSTLLPVTDAMRERWMLRSARSEFAIQTRGPLTPGWRRSTDLTAAYRDATRIAQLSTLSAHGKSTGTLTEAVRLMELSAMCRTLGRTGRDDVPSSVRLESLDLSDQFIAAAQAAIWKLPNPGPTA